ncbi:T-cell surface glycoprotein CD8 alpha chain-like isoform X2 [Stegostoma tigrinum]|uniref:T-cell surface glycoprotein CD8 alpha chain-like isoform X2 n=1 Tax=Stegostoma tigrinum TaxID=3053191 RepID=UPI00202B2F92|nr:T-cell surface glycoprotein CD8 alpha chain-like isoform X2 [Stegostoma tigrinum]
MKILAFLLAIQLTGTVAPPKLKTTSVKKGEKFANTCSLDADEGVYWFQQPRNSGPKFLLYVTGTGKVKSASNPERHTADKSSRKVTLTIKESVEEDEGKYYCFMVKNMAMQFGDITDLDIEGLPTTPEPTTIPATTQEVSTTTDSKGSTQCRSTERGTSQEKTEDTLSCHFIIWAPLTGAAALLLIALTGVSIAYCRRPRRRRCQHQFRKRPIAEEVRLSNRYL